MTGNNIESTVPETEPLSHTVVYAVAALNDVDPLDMDTRLYDCIDPDALDRLFTGADACGTLQFTMAGCHVEVSADRTVHVTRLRDEVTTAEASV